MYRRAGRGRFVLLAFLALSIVVITLDFRGSTDTLETAREISSAVVTPIQRGLATVTRPIGNFFSSLADLGNLRSENARLEAELEQAESQINTAEAIEAENERLRGVLDLDESFPTMERLTASVIGRPPSNYQWTVTIDKGSADGVEEDMAVVEPDGLVGKILDVDITTSTVRLLIDPQARVSAKINKTGYAGILGGQGADEPLSLDFIDTEARISIDDRVVTSGHDDSVYPGSIPIGRVSAIEGAEAALDQDIEVEPWVDFTTLDFVQVILDSGEESPRRKQK